MVVLDYKAAQLMANGREVDSFRISGFLAEDALVASLHEGVVALAEKHLGEEVMVNLDSRGRCAVKAFDENRRLAVEIARRVRTDLHFHGLELRQAKGEVANSQGRRLGDHDMVARVVMNSDLTIPDDRTPKGLLSGELRCRRLWSDSGRNLFRSQSWQESDFELRWWQDLLKADAIGKWGGRFIVLCCFDRSGADMRTYCDVRLRGQDSYRGLWGWPRSGRMLAGAGPRALPAPPLPAPRAPVVARAKSQAKAQAKAPAAPLGRKTWAAFHSELERKGLYRLEKPPAESARRVRVASCQLVVEACGKSKKHVGEKVLPAKRRHGWGDKECVKAPRPGKKKGGDQEHVAVERCLQQLFEDLS